MYDFHCNIDSWVHNKETAVFFKKYLPSIWNSIWWNWVFGILGSNTNTWKYLVFGVKYNNAKVFGFPNTLKVFDPAMFEASDFGTVFP